MKGRFKVTDIDSPPKAVAIKLSDKKESSPKSANKTRKSRFTVRTVPPHAKKDFQVNAKNEFMQILIKKESPPKSANKTKKSRFTVRTVPQQANKGLQVKTMPNLEKSSVKKESPPKSVKIGRFTVTDIDSPPKAVAIKLSDKKESSPKSANKTRKSRFTVRTVPPHAKKDFQVNAKNEFMQILIKKDSSPKLDNKMKSHIAVKDLTSSQRNKTIKLSSNKELSPKPVKISRFKVTDIDPPSKNKEVKIGRFKVRDVTP